MASVRLRAILVLLPAVLASASVLLATPAGAAARDVSRGGDPTFTVQSSGMTPALRPGDRVTVDTSVECCRRGAVVVFRNDENTQWRRPGVRYNLKRVVAMPGETITSCEATVCVDGKPLREKYLPKHRATTMGTSLPYLADENGEPRLVCAAASPSGGCTVPPGTLFVMGDNRANSADSRASGPIAIASVVGPVTADSLRS